MVKVLWYQYPVADSTYSLGSLDLGILRCHVYFLRVSMTKYHKLVSLALKNQKFILYNSEN
jgi:hypothetical protein